MQTPSSKSSHAILPLHSLLEKDLASMSQSELAAEVNKIRLLRTSPPTLAKAIRDDPDVETGSEATRVKSSKKASPKIDAAAFLTGLMEAVNTKEDKT
jgi:hypothetical protein